MLKAAQIREMTEQEMGQKIEAIRKELFELSSQLKAGRVEKPHRINQARKEMARILTILREKQP